MRIKRQRTFHVPRFGDHSAPEPEMVEVTEQEIIGVLAWRIHALQEQIAALRDAGRVS